MNKKSQLSLIKYIIPIFMKYKWILILDLFCAILTTASELVLPLLLRYITNLGIYNISSLTIEVLIRVTVIFLIIKIIDIVAGYYMNSIGHIMGAMIETDMRRSIYSHLQSLSNNFYDETKVGQLMSRITNDLFDVTEFSHHCPEEYFIGFVKIIIAFIILFSINPILTITIFLFIPIMMVSSIIFRKNMRKAQYNQRKQIGNINSAIEDSLAGIRVVKSFANENVELERFQNENNKFLGYKKVYYKSMAKFMSVNRIFDGVMYLVLLTMGGYMMMRGTINPGDMIIYAMYVSTLLMTVRRVVEFTEQFQKGTTGIERYREIMEIKTDIADVVNAIEVMKLDGVIDFENVSFEYNNSKEKILSNINLHIDKGVKLAIVGPSGSGKTTICNLIPRFYDVSSGSIKIDGIDIRDMKLSNLRANIGIVQQDVYLFSGTVRDNIAYGKIDATMDDIINVSKLAGAYDFIMKLPNGFDTIVGERGVLLSGGEKQRISIARVFLKNPPILILDEATSALDNKSESIVQSSIEKLANGRTTIIIAHRLTTIQDADKIIVVTKDGIIEQGSHEHLMSIQGYYYDLYTKGGILS